MVVFSYKQYRRCSFLDENVYVLTFLRVLRWSGAQEKTKIAPENNWLPGPKYLSITTLSVTGRVSIEDRNGLAVAAAASLAATIAEREMTPHVREYEKGNLEKNSLTEAERSDERRAISQRKRKSIKWVFG